MMGSLGGEGGKLGLWSLLRNRFSKRRKKKKRQKEIEIGLA